MREGKPMWWHSDLPVPAGAPAQPEAPPGAVPGEELLFLLDMRANELATVLFSLFDPPATDKTADQPFLRLPSGRKSD
jgi:hypothetical protein